VLSFEILVGGKLVHRVVFMAEKGRLELRTDKGVLAGHAVLSLGKLRVEYLEHKDTKPKKPASA
jgi:hypothetical protein